MKITRQSKDHPAESAHSVLLISGVAVASVPVLKEFERWLKSRNITFEIVELDGRSRFRFIARSVIEVIRRRRQTVIFVNPQALVALRITQCLPIRTGRVIYWAFESSTSAPLFSPVWAGIVAERIVRHKVVDLIIPLEERRKALSAGYRTVQVFENVAESGRVYTPRNISHGEPIHLVLYGRLAATYTYVQEFMDMVAEHPQLYSLTLIGDLDAIDRREITASNIACLSHMSHDELMNFLKGDFHYSVVGYKPINFNYRFCAPNKLFESYSISLPVLANAENPTLARLVADCGVVSDFDDMNPVDLHNRLRIGYSAKQESAFMAYRNTYNFDSKADAIFSFLDKPVNGRPDTAGSGKG